MVVISMKKTKSKKGFQPKRGSAVAVSAPLRAAIKDVAKSQLETKYVAEYIDNNFGVTAGASVPAGLRRMIPILPVGTGDANRLGDKVEPVKAKCDVTVHFQSTPTGGAGAFSDCIVHCLFLAVKGARNQATVNITPAGTLLKNGAGGNIDPTVASASQIAFLESINQMPVNTEQFTVLKRMSRRFAKGDYDINGPAGPTTSGPQKSWQSPAHTFTYAWKPPTLIYNGNPLGPVNTLPTNHYPVFIMWCTTLDGGPYAGDIYYGSRSEMWYKDA